MDPIRELAATGARRAFRADPRPEPHLPARDLGSFHDDSGKVRKEKAQADLMAA
jgi:hypothetical protein